MELTEYTNIRAALDRYGKAVADVYRANLGESKRPTTEDTLRNTMTYEIEIAGSKFAVNLNLQEYWKFIEYGTKPHFPPISAIRRWVEIKPVAPRPMANGKLPTPAQLAYLIARKISRVGTEGKNDLQRAVKAVNAEHIPLIKEAIAKDISEMMVVAIHEAFVND